MNRTLVIYHGGCRDGFCAAWVVNKYLQTVFDFNEQVSRDQLTDFIPGYYGQEPPDVAGKHVIIVDFAYSPEVMGDIALNCQSLIWLDHHKTAAPVADLLGMLVNTIDTGWKHKIQFMFDLAHSGAGIAWNYFFKGKDRPWLVDYVEDRDLWVKKLTDTDIINAFIATLEFSFNVWDNNSSLDLHDAYNFGFGAHEKTKQYIREVCKNVYVRDIIAMEGNPERKFNDSYLDTNAQAIYHKFRQIPVVNICQIDCSEVLHELCKLYPKTQFSLYWFKRADGMYQYGLRSIGDFDVSTVAKLFGGGGHKNAAGFQLDYLLPELK